MNLGTARVFVRSLAEARGFYANALGLPVETEDLEAGFLVFGAGNCQLVIEPMTVDAPPEDQALVGRFTGLSFSVSDIHPRDACSAGRSRCCAHRQAGAAALGWHTGHAAGSGRQ